MRSVPKIEDMKSAAELIKEGMKEFDLPGKAADTDAKLLGFLALAISHSFTLTDALRLAYELGRESTEHDE